MPYTKSPLRYPDGKNQLWRFVKNIIELNNITNPIYCEPFAGESGVTVELLLGDHVEEVIINDFDPAIYSFQNMCINNSEEFINLINATPITIKEQHNQKEIYLKYGKNSESLKEAFTTFFLNRTNVSGIISGGPIGGESQGGKYEIDCRFDRDNLIKKIKNIAKHKNRIRLYNEDASSLVSILRNDYSEDRLFTFFDPPYYDKGQSLYLSFCSHEQRVEMKDKILSMDDYYWILTYDKAPQIADLYANIEQTFECSLKYSANKRRMANEYLFASPITKLKSAEKIVLKKV